MFLKDFCQFSWLTKSLHKYFLQFWYSKLWCFKYLSKRLKKAFPRVQGHTILLKSLHNFFKSWGLSAAWQYQYHCQIKCGVLCRRIIRSLAKVWFRNDHSQKYQKMMELALFSFIFCGHKLWTLYWTLSNISRRKHNLQKII